MSSYFLSSFGVVTTNSLKYFMMVESSSFVCDFNVRKLSPSSNNLIFIFIIADFDWIVDYISNWIDQFIKMDQMLFLLFFYLLLFFFIRQFCFDFLFARVFFVGFLFVSDHFSNIIPLFLQTIEVISNYIIYIVLFLQTWSYSMILSTNFGSLNLLSKLFRIIFGSNPFSSLNQLISNAGI